jgi:hypothetical protein
VLDKYPGSNFTRGGATAEDRADASTTNYTHPLSAEPSPRQQYLGLVRASLELEHGYDPLRALRAATEAIETIGDALPAGDLADLIVRRDKHERSGSWEGLQ